MQYQHAMSRSISIPPLLLMILQQIILSRVTAVAVSYQVSHRLVGDGRHILHLTGIDQLCGCEPSTVHTLVTGEGGRSLPTALSSVVRAVIHQVPYIHAKGASTGVIHIGEEQAMAELMAGCTYAIHHRTRGAPEFTRTGIGVNGHTIEGQGTWTIAQLTGSSREFILMRPDSVRRCSSMLAITSIYHKHLIHISIIIPVIPAEIDGRYSQPDSLGHHLSGVKVITYRIVLSIIRIGLAQRHGPQDIKVEGELSIALTQEIVSDRTTAVVLGIPWCIEKCLIISGRMLKFQISELRQDDQSLTLAIDGILFGAPCRLAPGAACQSPKIIGHPARLLFRLHHTVIYHHRFRVAFQHKCSAVISPPIMEMLVTRQRHSQPCTIGQGEYTLHTLGWHSSCSDGDRQQYDEQKQFLHTSTGLISEHILFSQTCRDSGAGKHLSAKTSDSVRRPDTL